MNRWPRRKKQKRAHDWRIGQLTVEGLGSGKVPSKQERDGGVWVRYFCHIRKPPRKAFSFLPSRVPGGSFFSRLLFPPPSTT
jgi:hypothetical protein